MSKSKIKKDKPLSPKKEFRSQIADQLKNTLPGLEEKLGKKEFDSRIRKATKLLTAGVKPKKAKPAKIKAIKKDVAPIEINSQ
jgi:hypothetical protein